MESPIDLAFPVGCTPGMDCLISSGTAGASTMGSSVPNGDTAHSEAFGEDLSLGLNIPLLMGLGNVGISADAEALMSEATAECDNSDALVMGDSTITNLNINVFGSDLMIPIDPDPNTELLNLDVLGLLTVTIIANEQVRSDTNGTAEITVNALRISATLLGEEILNIVIASSHADIVCPTLFD